MVIMARHRNGAQARQKRFERFEKTYWILVGEHAKDEMDFLAGAQRSVEMLGQRLTGGWVMPEVGIVWCVRQTSDPGK